MIAAYVLMLQRGLKSIEDVPEDIRDQVREALDTGRKIIVNPV